MAQYAQNIQREANVIHDFGNIILRQDCFNQQKFAILPKAAEKRIDFWIAMTRQTRSSSGIIYPGNVGPPFCLCGLGYKNNNKPISRRGSTVVILLLASATGIACLLLKSHLGAPRTASAHMCMRGTQGRTRKMKR